MHQEELRRRCAGMLIGGATGDMLGAGVEGSPANYCRSYVKNNIKGDLPLKGRVGHGVGQVTDDTQLQRELAISICTRWGFDPEDYAQRLVKLFTTNRVVGAGKTTHDAVMHMAAGMPWGEAGDRASEGNGSAMRAAPLGVAFRSDEEDEFLQACRDMSRMTHDNSASICGVTLIAGAIRHMMENGFKPVPDSYQQSPGLFDPEPFIARMIEISKMDPKFERAIGMLPDLLKLPPREAVLKLVELDPYHPSKKWQYISPWVVTSVTWALYSFLKTPDDYMETICTAIGCGGDVDSTAAMAGSISGFRFGCWGRPDTKFLPEAAVRVKDLPQEDPFTGVETRWPIDDYVMLGYDLARKGQKYDMEFAKE